MGGIGALVLINTAGVFTGVTLGYSWLCIVTSVLLGVPGVVTMIVIDGIIK